MEFIIDDNATRAAIRAGYAKRSAQEQSSRLLSKDIVKQRVNELRARRAAKLEIKADRVLEEIYYLATVDITQAFDESGRMKPFTEMPENVRRSLGGVEVHELFDGHGEQKHAIGLARKFKAYDKTKALELIGRHLKLFTDKIEHSGKLTLEDLVSGSSE